VYNTLGIFPILTILIKRIVSSIILIIIPLEFFEVIYLIFPLFLPLLLLSSFTKKYSNIHVLL
jgi:hypothetical protein